MMSRRKREPTRTTPIFSVCCGCFLTVYTEEIKVRLQNFCPFEIYYGEIKKNVDKGEDEVFIWNRQFEFAATK